MSNQVPFAYSFQPQSFVSANSSNNLSNIPRNVQNYCHPPVPNFSCENESSAYVPQCYLQPPSSNNQEYPPMFDGYNPTGSVYQSLGPPGQSNCSSTAAAAAYQIRTSQSAMQIHSQEYQGPQSELQKWIDSRFESGYNSENTSYAPSIAGGSDNLKPPERNRGSVNSSLNQTQETAHETSLAGSPYTPQALQFYEDPDDLEPDFQLGTTDEGTVHHYANFLPDSIEALTEIAQIVKSRDLSPKFYKDENIMKLMVDKLVLTIDLLKYGEDGEDLLNAVVIVYKIAQKNPQFITEVISRSESFGLFIWLFSITKCVKTLGELFRLFLIFSESRSPKVEESLLKFGILEAVTEQVVSHGFDINGVCMGILKNLSHHLRWRRDLLKKIFPQMQRLLIVIIKKSIKEEAGQDPHRGGKEAMRCFQVISNCILPGEKSYDPDVNKKLLDCTGAVDGMLDFLNFWCIIFPDHAKIKQYFDLLNKILYCLRKLSSSPNHVTDQIWCIHLRNKMKNYPKIMHRLADFLCASNDWKFVKYNTLDLVRNLSKSLVLAQLMRESKIIEKLLGIVGDAHTLLRAALVQGQPEPKWCDMRVSWYLTSSVRSLYELSTTPNNRKHMTQLELPRLIDNVINSEVGKSQAGILEECRRLQEEILAYSSLEPGTSGAKSPFAQLGSTMHELSLSSPLAVVKMTENVPPNSPNVENGSQTPEEMMEGSDIGEDDDNSDTERSRIINSVLDLQEEMWTDPEEER